jgi:gliding motility-associated-like protein
VAYSLNSIQWKLSQVPGVTPSADVVVNNPVPVQSEKIFGRTYYTYTLDQDLSFAVAGTYDIPVSYAAPDIDQCDQTETASVRVLVKDGPKADFNGSGIYCLKDQIQLKGNSNATGYDIKSYRWDFPDNTSQTTIDALKKFDVSGPQAIRYRIFADNGCTGDTVKTINVVKTTLVQASLSGTRCVDSLLTFTSSISTGNSGTQWYWDFGNGKTDSSKTPVVRYSYASGAVNLRLRHWVTDPLGCPSDTSETILAQVYNNPPAPPVLILSDTLCPGSMVTFGASLPYSPVSWSWDLGDGNLVGAAAPVTRRYDSAGSYVVTLQVRDANGCGSPVFAKQVNINRRPAINAGPDKYILLGSAANLEGSILSPLQYAYAWQPFIFLNDPSQLNPLCTPMTDMTYVVSARNNVTHCIAEDTMQVFVLTKIIIPNTFTPNNDGFNDRWDIRFLDRYPGCRIEVYNTAGQLVFRSVGYASPWDGRNNGRDLPGGTYYYVIDLANGEAKKAGYVTIIR